MEPEARLAAMRAFIRDYPKSKRVHSAQESILKTLLDSFPQRAAEIDAQAKLWVKRSGKGTSRWDRETYAALLLAEAGSSGVDLPLAEKLAADAAKHLTESAYDHEMTLDDVKNKMPLPKPEALHREFANTRADALAILADVYLRQGKQARAATLIAEAFQLDPLVDDVNSQRGRLALLDQDNALALDSFERAQLVGALSDADRKKMMELYRAAHAGSDAGFAAEMDARYAQLFPPPFTAEKAPTASGHAVLLELFTGSACVPCVGGDLAVDAVLGAYPRSAVVVLALDQHIPGPDPLANPNSVARAELYQVGGTPTFVVDGEAQDFNGSSRVGSRKIYDKLSTAVNARTTAPSQIKLKLSATDAGGVVKAHADVELPSLSEIQKELVRKTDSGAGASEAGKKTPVASAPGEAAAPAGSEPEPRLLINFALVEDNIRYSGENGIRFHRMVMRALAKPADSGFSVALNESSSLDASFDPAAISQSLTSYLDGFEQKNDRFGKITFLTKDMTMEPQHLAIAAWVQDSVTHRVLQSAYVPVGEPQKEAE
ncbi:hypothetical protein ACPOL_2250 [Acidisarcina polymorpha]|uniref:Uncharacterized protein n=1 Tax=Acidisarcina polymorpha TaxID=2211140 RepID=A0A2Z5FYH7_9BACT|nr:hypothetical protein ACPOL_2250 [Acidisarcina polymorpha]